MGTGDHRCEWRARGEKLEQDLAYAAQAVDTAEKVIATQAEALRLKDELLAKQGEQITQIQGTVEKLQRHVFGQRSEKMPPVGEALRKAGVESDPAAALEKRRENAEKKRQLVTREIRHKVPEEQKECPKCGGHEFTALGSGKLTELYEMLPSIIERQLPVQEKLRCKCGETILTAPGAARVYYKARYGPNFMANVVVAKVADAIPLHRQAKRCAGRTSATSGEKAR